MKIIIDNLVMQAFGSYHELDQYPLLADQNHQLILEWPTFLEHLGFGTILDGLPPFDPSQPIFQASVATLQTNSEPEVVFHVYDRLFAEILSQITSLPQINGLLLLQAVQDKLLAGQKHLLPALAIKEAAFKEQLSHTMHDLILYLAWERLCVCIGYLFNYPSEEPHYIKSMALLQQGLVESYQHIREQGRTTPGAYRLLEALFYYHMRPENMEKHSVEEWNLLSQSFPLLKEENKLADFFYLDGILKTEKIVYLTDDVPERVEKRVALAHLLISKIKSEFSQWPYSASTPNIFYLNK